MSKPTVIMTGTHTDARLEHLGLNIVSVPVIRTEKLQVAADAFTGSYDWIIFTSRNAVKFMAPEIESIDFKHVASIGRKTSGELGRLGITPDFEAEVFSQEGFIDKFPSRNGSNILYPASRQRRKKLEDYLVSQGCTLNAIDLYQAVTDEASIDQLFKQLNDADAITFASPSAVKAVMTDSRANEFNFNTKVIVAIGPVTERALNEYNIQAISPTTYTNDAMIELLRRKFEV